MSDERPERVDAAADLERPAEGAVGNGGESRAVAPLLRLPSSWTLRVLLLVAAVAALIATCSRLSAEDTPPVRTAMQEIFGALRVVAPIAYRDEDFAQRSNEARVEAALATLAHGVGSLEEHARSRDPGFAYLANGLADRAFAVGKLVEAGREEDARRVVRGMVRQCVACHARNPSAGDFALGRELVKEIDVAALPLRQRAELEIATRQVAQAIATYEKLLASKQFTGAGAPAPALVQYLALCFATGQRDRAVATLDSFDARPDVKRALYDDLQIWKRSIEELGLTDARTPGLNRARALVIRGNDLAKRKRSDRAALIYDLEARQELQRFLDGATDLTPEVAEAYYWMGLLEQRIWDRPWLSNAPPFFEEAIRVAPGAPFARDAYERLEAMLTLGYTGSSGTHLPADVQERLRALDRAVRDAARS